MKNIGILGYGEVGKAIALFYNNPKIKDLKRDDGLEGVEILHICIPWSDKFVKIAVNEIKRIKPELVIIHSSVAPGTTKKISKLVKSMVVHSPIRGVHPYLHKGVKVFIKYVGADDKKSGELAEKHLKSLGIRTKLFMPSATTELGKLFDTTYYGLCIVWHGEMKEMCDKFKVDFDKSVTDFNQSYNEGYAKLGKKNVVRPVLYPPQKGKPKHCIVPNATILNKYFKTPIFKLILEKYKDKL